MSDKNGSTWTVLVLGSGGSPARQFSLPQRAFRIGAGAGAFLLVLVLGLTATLGFGGAARMEANSLERENALLTSELEELRQRVNGLEGDLAVLSGRDAEFRVLAGLDSIDEDVRRVGVGGPGSPTLEAHPLFAVDPVRGEEAFALSYDLNVLERRVKLLAESLTEASDSVSTRRDVMEATPSILPTAGYLSSRFSNARPHPIHHRTLPHEGIDVAAPRGTPILAAAKGRVRFAGRRAGYGLVVELDHGFGHTTLYGHANALVVSRGQNVERGDVIAQVGSTGIATAPHLHYEVRVNGRPVDPLNYVIQGAVP
ncbi:MAG: M23 family metallopeptidase [Gemmatimonadota bacterium]